MDHRFKHIASVADPDSGYTKVTYDADEINNMERALLGV